MHILSLKTAYKIQTTILTHWGRVTHICVSKLAIIGSVNGLSPDRRQAIIWTNAGMLLIVTLRTNFNEILIEIHIISFKNIHLKKSSGEWRPFCLGLNVLTYLSLNYSSVNGILPLLLIIYIYQIFVYTTKYSFI